MQVKSLDHIHVYAADPDRSAVFYREHFGAIEAIRTEDEGGWSIFLSLGGHILVLGPLPPGLPASAPPPYADGAYSHGFGVAHFGLRVDDVVAAVRELKGAGVGVLGGPFEGTGLTYAYVAAPDGVVLELTQYETPD